MVVVTTKRQSNGEHWLFVDGIKIGRAWNRAKFFERKTDSFGLQLRGIFWMPGTYEPNTRSGMSTTTTKTLREAVTLASKVWGDKMAQGEKKDGPGGKREGAGRPPSEDPANKMISVKLTQKQYKSWVDIGSSRWLKRLLDEYKS